MTRTLTEIFSLADPFSVFEREYPTLVAIDSHGFTRNKLDFFEREREEMRVLTQATEISPNVWVRTANDCPIALAETEFIRFRTAWQHTRRSSCAVCSPSDLGFCVIAR